MSVFSPNTGKYGPEKTMYLDTFHAVRLYIEIYARSDERPKSIQNCH